MITIEDDGMEIVDAFFFNKNGDIGDADGNE
jgi:hypothetical protein